MKDYLSKYELSNVDLPQRYPTVAMQFYRKRLEAEATGRPFDQAEPSLEEGRKLPNGQSLDGPVKEPQDVDVKTAYSETTGDEESSRPGTSDIKQL